MLATIVGSMARAPAMNITNIHGEQNSANWASFLNPQIASVTTTAPTTRTTNTNLMSVGYHSTWSGMPNGMRIAEAETVIIAPARMQYMMALSTLYIIMVTGPPILRRYQ